jgi:Mn-dependent DtxR family transcriptional regulator
VSGTKGERRSPQARLQDRIILHLACVDDVETVAGLSRTLGSSRSSTSRAINRLKTAGLVLKAEGRWSLTKAGEAEEVRLRSQLSQRSRRVEKDIDRIAKFHRDYERTMGSATLRQINSMMKSLPRVPPGFGNVGEIFKAQAFLPRKAYIAPEVSAFKAAMGNLNPDVSAFRTAVENMSPNVSAFKTAVGSLSSPPVQLSYRMQPFFESMRLVNSVGVTNPTISSSLKAISESVLADKSAVMHSIQKIAATDSLGPATVRSLTGTLDLLNTKLSESVLASIQVRAVEDLYKRTTSPIIPSETLQSLTSHIALASGGMVRQTLEQADFGTLLKKYSLPPEVLVDPEYDGSSSPEDGQTASSGHNAGALRDQGVGASELPEHWQWSTPAQSWDELPEAIKLRVVAAATFIILHIAFLAAQDQQKSAAYVEDLVKALGGTAATVAICKQVEAFKDEEDD